MISRVDIKKIGRARLADANALVKAKRYDGAIYLCGYAIELALKARICKTLGWSGYPSSKNEFHHYESFKIHNLDVLSHLSGIEAKINTKYLKEWSAVATWDPGARYKNIGSATFQDAKLMVESAGTLLAII